MKTINKKGELSVAVIVSAAIALTVLVVLVLIFTGRLSNWNQAISDCEENNGICINEPYGMTKQDACDIAYPGQDYQYGATYRCEAPQQICCRKLLS